MAAMKILHVVGFKNSGKTTLVSRWVRLLKEQGCTVSVIKQHGHHGKHGKLKMPDATTDSMKFFSTWCRFIYCIWWWSCADHVK